MLVAAAGGFAMAANFAYVSNSPFVFQEGFGLKPVQYAIVFGVNALALLTATQVNRRLVRSVAPARILPAALSGSLVAALVLLFTAFTGVGGFLGVEIPLLVFIGGVGFVLPLVPAIGMAGLTRDAGYAAAIVDAAQFGLGGLVIAGASLVRSDRLVPMSLAMLGASGLALVSARLSRAD